MLCLLVCWLLPSSLAWTSASPRLGTSVLFGSRALQSHALYARVAKREEETTSEQTEGDGFITIPYEGLVGSERGGLFDTPLRMFDPMEDMDSVPGEDGSDEKIAAIQLRIKERVEELRKNGEWGEDVEEYGKDPLATLPLWQTIAMQLRTCKPYESTSELALTYVLILATTVVLSAYLLSLRDSLDAFIVWYTTTDFDGDAVSNLFRSANN